MAYGKNQRLRFKRRRNGETDYRRRMKMLRGGFARAVVRVTNTQTICQLVNYEPTGDKVKISIDGRTLVEKYGWPIDASRKSIPASYISGFAMAKAAIAAGHKEAVLDIGLAASTPGNRVFAALKGMVDAGMEIPYGESVLPNDDRINGSHIDDTIAKAVEAAKKSIEEA
ncbi:MAG: 50S ribosomal protein L18 [Candidatus Thermoplasmatota archaeon]|nr:50S ribosomal protein L18 [Candidatus Thermoplasmatota archaeon]